MARFDFNPLPTVNPSGSPTQGFSQRADASAFGGDVGRAMQGLGQSLDQVSDVASKHALIYQEMNNETYAKQADISLQGKLRALGYGDGKEPGYFSTGGEASFNGAKPTMDAANKAFDEVLGGMSSPAARQMFQRVGQSRVNSFSDSVATHAAQGRKQWMIGTSVARQAAAAESAADNYNDPLKIEQSIAVAKSENLSQGEIEGWSPEQTTLEQQKVESNIRVGVIDRMLTDDPLGAQKYYQKHIDGISGAQRTAVEKALKSAVTPVLASNIANAAMHGGAIPNAEAADVVSKDLPYDAIAWAESGGKDFGPDGKLITSPKGAQGKMQVMPGTGASPGFGVEPVKDGSPEERNRVGRDYYRAMLSRYGNQSLALAAYNAGPGKVDAALQRIGSAPGQSALVDPERVLSSMPRETREYVAKINAKAPPTPGSIDTTTDIERNRQTWVAAARQSATAAFGEQNPGAIEQTVNLVEQRAAEIKRGQIATDKAARDRLISRVYGFSTGPDGTVVQTPISQRPKNLTDLLQSPEDKRAWNDLDPVSQSAIMNRIGKDDVPKTAQTMGLRHYLDGLSYTDPQKFMTLNFADPQYVDRLPKADLAALMGQQNKMTVKSGKDAVTATNMQRALSVAAPILKASGVHYTVSPGTKGYSETKSKRYNAFVGALSQQLEAFADEHKRQPSTDDVRKMTGTLVAEGTERGSGWFWDKEQKLFEAQDITKFAPKVPDDEREKITAAYKRRYAGRAPTENQIQDAFKTVLLRRGGLQ